MPDKNEKPLPDKNEKPHQEVDIKKCSIDSVVVYSDRAEVKRTVPVTLPAGESDVVFKRLSESVDGESIRVEGRGSAVILDVVHYTSVETKTEEGKEKEVEQGEYEAVIGLLKEKKDRVKMVGFQIETLEKKRDLLRIFARHACHLRTQEDNSETVPDVVAPMAVGKVMEFLERYQTQLIFIDERLADLKAALDKLKEEIKVHEAKAAELNPAAVDTLPKKETVLMLKVSLEAKQETNVTLLVSYVVSNASWSPSYDLRVFSSDKSIKLHYYGRIKQSTGEDWENASLSLSTAEPSVGGSPPCLGIHYIQFRKPVPRFAAVRNSNSLGLQRYSFMDEALEEAYLDSCSSSEEDWSDSCNSLENFRGAIRSAAKKKKKKEKRRRSLEAPPVEVVTTEVDSAQLYNALYAIPRKSTIPADNTEHKVMVTIVDLKPEFSYASVPRLSPHSFLKATVKNTSVYTILRGPANVFLDNNFLAKSNVDSTAPNEEFTCSLGVDQSVRITSHPVSVVSGTTGRLTKNSLLTYTHKFSVKNTQPNVVKLKISEQVPLSTDERMKVVVVTPEVKKQLVKVPFPAGHVILNDSNNLEWHCTIPADKTLDLKLVYTVEHPLNDSVEGLPPT